MFEKCCASPSCIKYSIKHNPKPIALTQAMDTTIKKLLWYVPCIDSHQSELDGIVENSLYDDYIFTYILENLGMKESIDVKWIGSNEPFGIYWSYYEKKICCNCQKIIIRRGAKSTVSKTKVLLKHLRNCIAHGYFTIVNDYIIGFDFNAYSKSKITRETAVIKIKPNLLLNSLENGILVSESVKANLIAYAFSQLGYTVNMQVHFEHYYFDFIAEKDGIKYAMELIGEYNRKRYVHPEDLHRFLSQSYRLSSEIIRVIIIDSSRVTKKVRELESKLNNIKIIDKAMLYDLLKQKPVDILAQ